MASGERNPSDFTISELKNILRGMNLSTVGLKNELIARLVERDPSGEWMTRVLSVGNGEQVESPEIANALSVNNNDPERLRREMELCRREKEVMERELQVMRRENEWLRRAQNGNGSESASDAARRSPVLSREPNAANINTISGLLRYFEGDGGLFEAWGKRVKALQDAYGLTDDLTRIGARLRGKAQEWFHSNPEFTEITVNELLRELKNMFHHEPSRVLVRRQFEQRGVGMKPSTNTCTRR